MQRAEPDADRAGSDRVAAVEVPAAVGQKDFDMPSGGSQVRIACAPASSRKSSAASMALAVELVPLRRWQRVQWQ